MGLKPITQGAPALNFDHISPAAVSAPPVWSAAGSMSFLIGDEWDDNERSIRNGCYSF
jgi:hypothetical protein